MSFPGPPAPSRLRRVVDPLLQAVVDLIYPRLCCVCKVPLDDGRPGWFCKVCADELPLMEPPYCKVCGEFYDGAFTNEFRCMNCDGRRLEFEFAVAACRAEGVVREMIHQFKYERRLQLRAPLATLLSRTLQDPRLADENLAAWALVPVPLHRSRELDREFNQSWELCVRLSGLTGIPAIQALSRMRETDSQASLDRDERLKNLRGAFALRKTRPWEEKVTLQGRRILLVDDVFTTGATTSECARVLRREGGAEKVVVITVARG
ncbi:ComF family protein [Prosthecobacter sp.]|jgi:competence protein ComFC|uniref:ComF family protein n=1 Tax=Prosthecobacter sp. TaxID=1965333 RepID=UPI0037851772